LLRFHLIQFPPSLKQEGRAVAGYYRAMRSTCTENLHLQLQFSGNAVNKNNTKTISKHQELVEKPLYKCISEGLIRAQHGITGLPIQLKFTKFDKFRLASLLNAFKFCRTPTKVCETSVVKNFAARKSMPK